MTDSFCATAWTLCRRNETMLLGTCVSSRRFPAKELNTFPREDIMRRTLLTPGEPCPWFVARSTLNPSFNFSTTAGRYSVLCLFGSAANESSRQVLDGVRHLHAETGFFDVENYLFTGVSVDPLDEQESRIEQKDHGIRWFWDFDLAISQQLGSIIGEKIEIPSMSGYVRQSIILDERLRVLSVLPFEHDPAAHVRALIDTLKTLPPIPPQHLAQVQAPILVVPRIFEPQLCSALMEYYEERGGRDSGFMRDVDGMTVEIRDYSHKRRTDCEIEDERLRRACMVRIHDRLAPEIQKAFQFHATRMERFIVACYDASTSDHFRPHRDNTTKGTAHRRFAVSLVLNSGQFEGGYLRFPEFGRQLYAPPAGGAVVFSCSLLHEATPVTKGRRFVFLPFLYDDAAARIREENLKFVAANNTGGETKPAPDNC